MDSESNVSGPGIESRPPAHMSEHVSELLMVTITYPIELARQTIILCVLFQYINMYIVLVSLKLFLITRILHIVFNMYHLFISNILGINSLNSAVCH